MTEPSGPSAGTAPRAPLMRASAGAFLACAALALGLSALPAAAQVAVTTYHNDAMRTGWNSKETQLTWASMAVTTPGSAFGLKYTIPLDQQVDAQPLVVPNVTVAGDPNPGTHDVVYVATQASTVYAIDPTRGTILNSRNLGSAVIYPLGCHNAESVGINSTPVIDTATNSMYVMAYTTEGTLPTYTLHRLSLTDFSDIVPPKVVAASHSLTDGSTFTFNATYQRQRPALLLDHGAVYAAFGSFCDLKYNQSRGWLLGWQADNLTPLTANGVAGTVMSLLTDQQPSNKNNFFLSAIWMSGAGPAADADGNVYLVTGNSSKFENTYNSATNLAESAIKFNPATNSVTSYYTPANSYHLDQIDGDFGAGGIMLLPQSVTGLPSQLAVAAGKDGFLTLMDRTSLGGFATGPGGTDNPVTKVKMPACWCAPAYFSNGVPHIVTSGLNKVSIWTMKNAKPALVAAASAYITSGQDGGFFTSVSSNGSSDPIIWAVSRPVDQSPGNVSLYAFKGLQSKGSTTLTQLYAGVAGVWPQEGNSSIVPVVANGRVIVGSYKQLTIFGLGGTP